jgi:phage recombination protein Bet
VTIDVAIQQNTPAWLEARRATIGSSDIAVIAGESPHKSAYTLAAEKLGLVEEVLDDETRELMAIGHLMQPVLLELYESKTGRHPKAAPSWRRHREVEWATASLDGTAPVRRVVEAKWSHSKRWRSGERVPGDVYAQVEWQLFVTGWDVADVVVLDFTKPRVETIERDDAVIADLRFLAEDFRGYLDRGELPPIDGSESTRQTLAARYARDNGTWLPANAGSRRARAPAGGRQGGQEGRRRPRAIGRERAPRVPRRGLGDRRPRLVQEERRQHAGELACGRRRLSNPARGGQDRRNARRHRRHPLRDRAGPAGPAPAQRSHRMTSALVASAVDPDVSAALQIYERMKPLKEALGVRELSDNELQLFALVARHTGLDPFTKQIYAIKRAGRVTHQTGIDGYRSAAERTSQYAGSDEATFEECACGAEPKPHPSVARVVVHRILANGHVVDQVGIARWHELYPGAGDVGSMWRKMPYNQLAKCAEANGLRKAFPRVFGGVYIAEEMQGAPTVEGQATEVEPTPRTNESTAARIAARRAERQAPAAPAAAAAEPTSEDDTVEGSFTEAPVTEPEASTEPTLADTLRAAAIADGRTERAAQGDVVGILTSTFRDWDRALVLDGLRAVWGKEGVDKPTAAQVAALKAVGDAMPPAQLVAAWHEMVGGAA